jgi:uncharacterized protein (DUF433 family)
MLTKEDLLYRIEIDPEVMVGKPVIRGTRLTVAHILGLLAAGWTTEQITTEYKKIDENDIAACLLFAHEAMNDLTFVPLTADNC